MSSTHLHNPANPEASLQRQKIIDYLEDCHLSDGGYFFAKIEPSSGLETYLAVKTLNLLGAKIQHEDSVASFWEQESLDSLFGIFLAVETYRELGLLNSVSEKYCHRLTDHLKEGMDYRLTSFSSRPGMGLKSFSLAMNYIDAMGKDLQDLLYLVAMSRDLKINIDNRKIINLVLSLQNRDGGFGGRGISQLMTTYHALRIFSLLSYTIAVPEKIYQYLMNQWEKCDYLEDVFHAVESMALLGAPLPSVERVAQFVSNCQRINGGVSRARVMGIPTIEYSYYAVQLLKTCNVK